MRTLVVLDAGTEASAEVARAHDVATLAVDAYEAGADARVGAVYVDEWGEHAPGARLWFRDVYDRAGDPHPHVHGANLGVRTDAYELCEGFGELPTGEDHALVTALDAGGFTVHRTRRSPVRTSARRVGRVADGFAARLIERGTLVAANPAEDHIS